MLSQEKEEKAEEGPVVINLSPVWRPRSFDFISESSAGTKKPINGRVAVVLAGGSGRSVHWTDGRDTGWVGLNQPAILTVRVRKSVPVFRDTKSICAEYEKGD